MDFSFPVLATVLGWTLLGLLIVVVLWPRASWKAILAWLGLTLLPLGLYLVGLAQHLIDAWNALALWWQGLVFTVPVLAGLSVLGLAVLLLLVSRLIPYRKRVRKPKTPASITPTPPPFRPSSPPAAPSQAEQTLILPPEERKNL
jgi:hypothetical protein